MADFTYVEIARMIDHAVLQPNALQTDVEAGCVLAGRYGVASFCTMPCHLPLCADLLAGSGVSPGATIGFPHGVQARSVKAGETRRAVADGAVEVDMVANISKVVSGDWGYVRDDIRGVVNAAHAEEAKAKVIFENAYLTDAQKIRLCEICTQVGADWVKTSTGFAESGATVADCRLMLEHIGPGVQVKAAGGIRNLDALLEYRKLGVTRIGTRSTAAILDACIERVGR